LRVTPNKGDDEHAECENEEAETRQSSQSEESKQFQIPQCSQYELDQEMMNMGKEVSHAESWKIANEYMFENYGIVQGIGSIQSTPTE